MGGRSPLALLALAALLPLSGCESSPRRNSDGSPADRSPSALDRGVPALDRGLPITEGGGSGDGAQAPGLVGPSAAPYSLAGLPAPCATPYYAVTPSAAQAKRVLHVSPSGSDSNLGLSPPCPQDKPCRQLAALFARLPSAPSDRTLCDGAVASSRYLKYLQPGDLVLVEDGSYQPFEIRQACGTAADPITVYAPGGGAELRGAIAQPEGEGTVWLDTLFIRLSRYLIIDGLKLFDSTKAGIGVLFSSHLVIRNCEVGDHGEFPIFTSFATDGVIESCDVHGGKNQHGVYLSNSSQRFVVARNRFHDNAAAGLQVNPDASANFGIPEFPFEGLSHCMLFDGNLLFNNKGGGSFNLQGLRDSVIRNNLIQRSLTSGITLYYGDAIAGSGNVFVLNNTIDIVGGGTGGQMGVHLTDLAGPITLRNNIIYDRRANKSALAVGTAADLPLIDSDYNALGSVGPLLVLDYSGSGTPTTLAAWQAKGKDTHSIEASIDTLVVSASTTATYDYHLKPGSPAAGKGTFLADQLGTTFEGVLRVGSTPVDLGCY